MNKVREEVKILQQEYDSLLSELERKGQELVQLKTERTRKRRDALSETPAANMKVLVDKLRSLQEAIGVNNDKALRLDDELDEARMAQLMKSSQLSAKDEEMLELRWGSQPTVSAQRTSHRRTFAQPPTRHRRKGP